MGIDFVWGELRVGGLFSGIGGLELGLERAGMECIFWCEIDENARRVLMRRWPNVWGFNDVRQVSGDDVRRLGGIDLLCGGFPCQDVSVAGSRAGLDGARSGLFFEFVRIVNEVHPAWIVLENVPGLLSSNEGRDMGTVLGTLGELGYGYAYRVLDARYTGVPQRRRRVFIVGCARDWGSPAKVLLEPEGVFRDLGTSHAARQEAAGTLTARTTGGGFPGTDESIDGYVIPYRKMRRAQSSDDPETWGPDDVANTLNTFDVGEGRETQLIVEKSARKLMPVECERLQGFPDGWTEGQSDSNRYKQLGNAVAVPCAEWIGKRIMEVTK